MKFKIPLPLLIFLFTNFIYANPDLTKLIKKGLEESYSFHWIEAEKIFNNLRTNYPDDPSGYHYTSGIYLWYYLSSNNSDDFNSFVKYSDAAIEKAKQELNLNPEKELTLYTLGAAYTYRAIAFAKAENYLDAAWASKESESYLSHTIKVNPENFDAYLGLGLYNFAVAQIPTAFKWALEIAGINGSTERGIKYIKLAASKGKLSKVEAEYYLSQILSEVMFDYNEASVHLKNLVKKYPSNIIFNYSLASNEIKRKNLESAQKTLSKIINKDLTNFKQVIALSNFLTGDIYFRQNNFDSAKVYYERFLSKTSNKDFTGIAAYRMALSCELSGDRKTAEQYFELSGNGNPDLEDDLFAKRKGEIYSKRTLSITEMELIKSYNMMEAGKYKEAYDSLLILNKNIKTGKLLAESNLYLSEALFFMGEFKEALNYAIAAFDYDDNEENWIKPFASFYAAKNHKALNNFEAAERFLDEAEDQNDYDYQNKLENMINALKNSLEHNNTNN
jgi:TolA-binding protein